MVTLVVAVVVWGFWIGVVVLLRFCGLRLGFGFGLFGLVCVWFAILLWLCLIVARLVGAWFTMLRLGWVVGCPVCGAVWVCMIAVCCVCSLLCVCSGLWFGD